MIPKWSRSCLLDDLGVSMIDLGLPVPFEMHRSALLTVLHVELPPRHLVPALPRALPAAVYPQFVEVLDPVEAVLRYDRRGRDDLSKGRLHVLGARLDAGRVEGRWQMWMAKGARRGRDEEREMLLSTEKKTRERIAQIVMKPAFAQRWQHTTGVFQLAPPRSTHTRAPLSLRPPCLASLASPPSPLLLPAG